MPRQSRKPRDEAESVELDALEGDLAQSESMEFDAEEVEFVDLLRSHNLENPPPADLVDKVMEYVKNKYAGELLVLAENRFAESEKRGGTDPRSFSDAVMPVFDRLENLISSCDFDYETPDCIRRFLYSSVGLEARPKRKKAAEKKETLVCEGGDNAFVVGGKDDALTVPSTSAGSDNGDEVDGRWGGLYRGLLIAALTKLTPGEFEIVSIILQFNSCFNLKHFSAQRVEAPPNLDVFLWSLKERFELLDLNEERASLELNDALIGLKPSWIKLDLVGDFLGRTESGCREAWYRSRIKITKFLIGRLRAADVRRESDPVDLTKVVNGLVALAGVDSGAGLPAGRGAPAVVAYLAPILELALDQAVVDPAALLPLVKRLDLAGEYDLALKLAERLEQDVRRRRSDDWKLLQSVAILRAVTLDHLAREIEYDDDLPWRTRLKRAEAHLVVARDLLKSLRPSRGESTTIAWRVRYQRAVVRRRLLRVKLRLAENDAERDSIQKQVQRLIAVFRNLRDEARKPEYAGAVDRADQQVSALHQAGVCFLSAGRFYTAARIFRKCLSLWKALDFLTLARDDVNHRNVYAYCHLGEALIGIENYDHAEKYLRRAGRIAGALGFNRYQKRVGHYLAEARRLRDESAAGNAR